MPGLAAQLKVKIAFISQLTSLKQLPVFMHNPKEEMINEEKKPKSQLSFLAHVLGLFGGKGPPVRGAWISWLLTVPGLTQLACFERFSEELNHLQPL